MENKCGFNEFLPKTLASVCHFGYILYSWIIKVFLLLQEEGQNYIFQVFLQICDMLHSKPCSVYILTGFGSWVTHTQVLLETSSIVILVYSGLSQHWEAQTHVLFNIIWSGSLARKILQSNRPRSVNIPTQPKWVYRHRWWVRSSYRPAHSDPSELIST